MRPSKKILKLSLTLVALWAMAGATAVLGDGGAPADDAWEASLKSARALQADRNYDAAREALDVAKSSDVRAAAGNELAVAILGVRKPSKKDLALAEETLRTAIDGEGEHRDYYALNLATVLQKQGQVESALEAARRAMNLSRDSEVTKASRIVVCGLRKQLGNTKDIPRIGSVNARRVGDDGVVAPRKIHAPAPVFPNKARKKRVEGVVIVESIIDTEGCVIRAKVLKGLGYGLDESALESTQGWVFEPARFDGHSVPVIYNLTLNYRLQ